MKEEQMVLTVLGCRGSMAMAGEDYQVYGGATSCYMIQADGETLFLDAGSGLIGAPVQLPRPPVILLSHLHLDHLLGLGMYPRLSQKGLETNILVPVREGEQAKDLLNTVYSPPYWPLSLESYAGNVIIQPLALPMRVGGMLVEGREGFHPGGCMMLKISFRGKTLVYMTDYEFGHIPDSELLSFLQNADLLMVDGQYSPEIYPFRKGFGHSTDEEGIRLMELCGARQLLVVHHDPQSTDRELARREKALNNGAVRYARDGMVIRI